MRGPRSAALTAALTAVLATGLAACSSGPEQTTCGEVRAMTQDERVDLVREVASEAGADEPSDPGAVADRLVQGCEGRSDGTTLDEVEQFPAPSPTGSALGAFPG